MSSTSAPTRARRRVAVGLTLALLAAVPAVRIATGAAADPPDARADVPSRVEVAAPAAPARPARTTKAARTPKPSTAGPTAGDHPRDLGTADGRLPDGATVRDTRYPGVARLDPDLRAALRAATADAADDGVRIRVTSGWRSRAYQAHLLADAVSHYGSRAEAARWVATPDTSPHVDGDAVDVGPTDAMTWLARHGEEYGLCRVYANEPWHVELREDAVDDGCPAPYADPTHDPRMVR